MNPIRFSILIFILLLIYKTTAGQPNWTAIKANAVFNVADTSYASPIIQPINVAGWEDGLYITRDGRNIYSTYLPVDAFSWLFDLLNNPFCFDFNPYYRPPLLGIDTVTNIFGCPNYMHSDIVISQRSNASTPFTSWNNSQMQASFSLEGGAQGVLLNQDTFDLFVYTQDGPGTQSTDIKLLRNVPVNPDTVGSVILFGTPAQEDNPHLERINDSSLVILFDRDRYIYYATSIDNGISWSVPALINNVINDQSPYDAQPHLWYDGTDWWVYFCADNNGIRGIYKSKQITSGDWNNWTPKELVIEGSMINGGYGTIFGIGEPSLTMWGDLSFVVVYGDSNSTDTTDVYDCDPWILPKKGSPLYINAESSIDAGFRISPQPAYNTLTINSGKIRSASEYFISNMKGEIVKTGTMNVPGNLSIEELPVGNYILSFGSIYGNLQFIKMN